jgi:Putative peptidoglycan binding domain
LQADEPFLSLSLRWLGYDLLGAEHAGEGAEGVGLRRAIMAFQAGEGFPVTGQLSPEQLDRLYTGAARAVDIDARKAAKIARDVARDVSESGYDEERYALRSLRAGVRDGKLYGIGEFRFGGTFEGEWLESLDTGAAQRPGTGILRASDTCSIALRNQGALAVETLNDVLDKAIGVLRLGNRIEFSRDLAGLLPERDSTEPVTLESICSPPKEEEQDN